MGAATFEKHCVFTCSASVQVSNMFLAFVIRPRIFPHVFPHISPAVFGTISCPGHGAHHRRSHSREQSLKCKRRHKHSLATQAQTQLHKHRPNHYAGRTPRADTGKRKCTWEGNSGPFVLLFFLLVFFSLKEFATTPPPHTPHFNVALVLFETPSCFNPTVGNKDTACPEGKNV